MSWLDDVFRRLDLVTVPPPPGEAVTLTWDFVNDQHVVMPKRCSGDPAHEGIAAEKKIPGKRSKGGEKELNKGGCALSVVLNLILLPLGFIYFPGLWSQKTYTLTFNHSTPYCAQCYRGMRRANAARIILTVLLVISGLLICTTLPLLFGSGYELVGGLGMLALVMLGLAILVGLSLANSALRRSQTIQIMDFDPMGQSTQIKLQFLNRDYADLFLLENGIRALHDPRSDARERSARQLGQIGNTRATLPLVNALDDSDDRVRQAAAGSLIQLGDPEAVEPLVQNLHKPDVATRLATVEVLGKLRGERAVEALVESLAVDEAPQVRVAAAKGLALADTAVVSPLIAALGDPVADVRTRAVKSLEALEARQAVPALIGRLDDPADEVRRAAAGALGVLNDPTAIDPLIRTLQDPLQAVRWSAAHSLMALDPGRPLIRALHSLTLGETVSERAQAATTLGGLGDARAVPALRRALDDQDQVCQNAARALVRFGPNAALEPLAEALTGPTPGARVAAVEALGELADNRAEGPLLQALQDPAAEVRQSAAAALVAVSDPSFRPTAQTIQSLVTGQAGRRAAVARLAELGDRRAASPVTWALLHDEDVDVRIAAARALPRLDAAPIELLVQALGTSASAKAVEVLVALGSDTIALLIEAVQATEGSAQLAAIDALGQIGDERAVESLIGALQSTGAQTRGAASQALGRMVADPRVVPALTQMLQDNAPGVRDSAAQALGQSGDPRAVEPLVQALDDRRLRHTVSGALRQLGDLATEALLARYQREKNKEVRQLIGDLLGDKKPPSLKDKLFGRKRK